MSTKYKNPKDVPTQTIIDRLKELSDAAGLKSDSMLSEFTRRIPAELDRDADLVLYIAAKRLEELERLRAENGNQHDLIMRQCDILTNTANALKGEPDSLSLHSHHDLAEVASKLNAERQKLISFVTEISEQFHWDLCSQCEDNIYNAEDIIEEIKESEND